jgi:hypothetical protein
MELGRQVLGVFYFTLCLILKLYTCHTEEYAELNDWDKKRKLAPVLN